MQTERDKQGLLFENQNGADSAYHKRRWRRAKNKLGEEMVDDFACLFVSTQDRKGWYLHCDGKWGPQEQNCLPWQYLI